MSQVLPPEPSSGEYRIPQARPVAATEPVLPAGRRRLDHVDLLRGLVMVIMVLDHVRDYFTEIRFDPTDLTRTNLALFATRWITHYCAPVFIFLAGASAWIAGTRRTRGQLARFLLSRGLWLILLEVTVISFGWYFSTRWPAGARAQVIWAIGASMVVLAGLIYLPRAAVAVLGLALVLGHNLLDGIAPEAFGAFAPLWRVLHVPGPLRIIPVGVTYPLVPWIGVMALGYVAGPAVFSQDAGAPRRLAWAGALLILGFVVLRGLNGYGDPRPRLEDGSPGLLAMSFLNTTKYPPSLLYVLMTLGPALVALALLRRAKGPVADVLVTFGRVPFLFYVAHLYVVHALAVAAGVAQGYPASAIRTVYRFLPEGYGFGLPVVYLVWLGVVAALYPLCRRYAALKARSRAWWLSYL
ncbi:MAG TPA: heparan-alpha-glucosaminide N-acetyltransferase domain-containing protein [Gemmatimonadales bacterium]|nr:heparan-alpha-glucosaminide N-acetyltransferase domain-containing protein [Gemmatimonadales bacterium]